MVTSPASAEVEPLDEPLPAVIPAPVSTTVTGDQFVLGPAAQLRVATSAGTASGTAELFAEFLRTATGYGLPVVEGGPGIGNIHLALTGDAQLLGQEGYTLAVDNQGVRLAAATVEGLFRGTQTVRQLLPPEIESASAISAPWVIPGVQIVDYPRFSWRGSMLDPARNFFDVAEVKRYIDLIALYKINRLHLSLTNDQGWRIWIDSWPDLALVGGQSGAGGGPGGYYTKAEYTEIVNYAAERHIIVIPEINGPGHSNAAEASYPELNSCREGNLPSHRFLDGWQDAPFFTGYNVGFSGFCVHDEITYEFLDDVIREVAEITPGPYLHVGGDEAFQTPAPDYTMYLNRVRDMVADHGKTMVGWHEVARANPAAGSIAQHWTRTGSAGGNNLANLAASKGMQILMSPADRIYLDMKYAPGVPAHIGLTWAGTVEVRQSYEWDPATQVPGVGESDVIGVEAPLWGELITNLPDAELMAFPRLVSAAEIGWTPQAGRQWADFRLRLAGQAPRWDVLEVNYYRSPQVPWSSESAPFSTLSQWQDFAIERMVDGDLSTFYWSNRAPGAGDYFGVDLGRVESITGVEVYMATFSGPSNQLRPTDYIHAGVLEISSDFETWQTVAQVSQAEVSHTFPTPTEARYIRIRAVAGQPDWLQVREFIVER